MRDLFDEPITVESIITYPTRRGSILKMVDAVVISTEELLLVRPIRERTGNAGDRPRDGEITVIKNVHTVTVLPHLSAGLSPESPSGYEIINFEGSEQGPI